MSISSEHIRRKKTVTDANGNHIPVSEWTDADSVTFENGLQLDELIQPISLDEYNALSDEDKNNGTIYFIPDADTPSNGISYDNSVSGLTATDIQGAINEEDAKLDAHIANKSNIHNVTKSQVGLGNVPNVTTNDQTPTYTVASSNTALTSGEKLNVAFGKIAKAVSSLISHLADTVSHTTSTERTKWNGYANSISNNTSNIAKNTTAISELNSDIDSLNTKLDNISTVSELDEINFVGTITSISNFIRRINGVFIASFEFSIEGNFNGNVRIGTLPFNCYVTYAGCGWVSTDNSQVSIYANNNTLNMQSNNTISSGVQIRGFVIGIVK